MKLHPKRILAGSSALVIATGVMLATAGTAFAVTPGWEPDPNSIGSITFTDASGAPITSGSLSTPMGAFALGSHAGRTGDTKATLIGSTPKSGVDSQLWSTEQLSSSTIYSPTPAGTPADLGSTGLPLVTSHASDETLATYISDFPNTSTAAGFQNLYEIRLYTSGTSASGATFDSADVVVDTTAGTWTQVYPAATDATTTTLTENPPSPDLVTGTPQSVTLNASVSAAAPGVPAAYTGPIGAVQFFDGATQVGATQLVTGTGPYTASFVDSVTNPSTHMFKAVFSAFSGSTLIGSQSAPSTWSVSPPLPTATTTLAATWQPFSGGTTPTHFSGTVTGNGTTPPALTGGTVSLFDNGSSTPLNSTPLTVGAGGAFSADIIIVTSGPHSVVATFTDPTVYLPSSSSPVTQTLGSDPNATCAAPGHPATGAGSCTDPQTITGTVPAGTLSVSTPYTAAHPFNVGTLALDSTGTILTANAQFGGAGLDPTNANADIIVTDTRAGNLNWTLQAQSTNLQDATSDVINSQNVGLTGLGSHPAPGFNTAGLVGFDNTAANGVAPADPGNLGLGGAIKHDVAQATHGIGTVGIYGTLTLNAPTSTPAGIYTGTLTFTIVGSLV